MNDGFATIYLLTYYTNNRYWDHFWPYSHKDSLFGWFDIFKFPASRGKWRRIHSNLYSWHLQSLQLYKIVFPWYYHIYWNGIINHFILELNQAFWTFDLRKMGPLFSSTFLARYIPTFKVFFSFLCQCIA